MNYTSRIEKLQAGLKNNQALYVSSASDIFYLSGFSGTFAKIIITRSKTFFLTDYRYKGVAEALSLSENYEVVITNKPVSDRDTILKGAKKVLHSPSVSLAEYNSLKKPSRLLCPSRSIAELREVKDEDEVALIKRSANITRLGIEHVASILKDGITEKELALEFEFFTRRNGADSVSFLPIIAFDENSAIPHHMPGERKLAKNSLVLMDCGVKYRGYCSDLTRVMAFCIMSTRLKDIKRHYNIVKTAKDRGVAFYENSLPIERADRQARAYLAKHGVEKFFTHSLGHGTGIDIHEPPFIRKAGEGRFKSGMVVTCEPGIYLEHSYGIRIEDDYLIGPNQAQKLSPMDDALIIVE